MERWLNIVSLNIPYPPNYGGIIDIYYKLVALHDAGVKIILHCFEYERGEAPELKEVCEEVHYYHRHTGLLANLTLLPYNVNSRRSKVLLKRLLQNDYPILFEGLHCCSLINHPALDHRTKVFRECNIEHDYYRNLAQSSDNIVHKAFYLIEAWRFKRYQPTIKSADVMICVSKADADYLKAEFPHNHVEFIPCFHANNAITSKPGKSDFILYHGKLSVEENERAALFLIKNVFSRLPYRCLVAGMNPRKSISDAAKPFPNIEIIANPPSEVMNYLIGNAQVNALITFQDTGLKLKLLNSLFAGRFTMVNKLMLTGSGLDSACHIADSADNMVETCHALMNRDFTQSDIDARKRILFPTFSNKAQADRLISMIFETYSIKTRK